MNPLKALWFHFFPPEPPLTFKRLLVAMNELETNYPENTYLSFRLYCDMSGSLLLDSVEVVAWDNEDELIALLDEIEDENSRRRAQKEG